MLPCLNKEMDSKRPVENRLNYVIVNKRRQEMYIRAVLKEVKTLAVLSLERYSLS